MKPDVIVSHPRDVLYPWWQRSMAQNRHLFGKLIVIMTQYATPLNFTNYIKAHLPDAVVIEEYYDDGHDWRNAAINEALNLSDSDRVLFLEQDFLCTPDWLQTVLSIPGEMTGFYQGERLHPAFLMVSKAILNRTKRDFSVTPDKGDHFYAFTKELEQLGDIWKLQPTPDWHHLSGLTQNYRLDDQWHNAREFYMYNHLSMRLPQHPSWLGFCYQKETQMTEKGVLGTVEPYLGRFFQ